AFGATTGEIQHGTEKRNFCLVKGVSGVFSIKQSYFIRVSGGSKMEKRSLRHFKWSKSLSPLINRKTNSRKKTQKNTPMMKKLMLMFTMLLPGFFTHAQEGVFVEAESFESTGGWVIDQQSFDVLFSSYLMAHGMGKP